MSTRPGTHEVRIADLRMDGGTQARAALDEDTIAAYAEAYKAGDGLPAPVVFDDDEDSATWLADGFHRVYGAQRAGLTELRCHMLVGTRAEAVEYAAGANATHGLRRTNADKRRAVAMLLALPKYRQASDRTVAEAARVDHKTVAAERAVGKSPPAKREQIAGHRGGSPLLDPVGDEGAEGAGTPVAATPRGDTTNPSAPDELAVGNSPLEGFDQLGLSVKAEWLQHVAHVCGVVDQVDAQMRRLQGLVGNSPPPTGTILKEELHRVGSLSRSMRPAVACGICRDPDGRTGAREKCKVCRKRGWLSAEEAKGLHPAALRAAE